jgi:alpha-tubulin suppressor-like RCC1 family protein
MWQTSAAAVFCWGLNSDGQLGDGTTTARNYAVASSGFNSVVRLFSGGEDSVLAIRANGSLWAWGDNTSGKLGSGDTADKTAPVQVRAP